MTSKKQTTYSCLRSGAALAIFVSVMACASGCATPQVEAPTPAEQARAEIALGTELSQQLEAQLQIAQDPEVSIYLRAMAEKLLSATPGGTNASVGVLVVKDRGGPWRSFSLPGNRIYLSSGLLKSVEYEHELAAALAIELAHVARKHLVQRIQEIRSAPAAWAYTQSESARGLDFFSPVGAFAFSEQAHAEAVEDAFEILYRTGFDPRGLSSLFSIYRKNAAKSPFEDNTAERLLSTARQVTSRTAPLRNPILRSQDFVKFKNRIRSL